MKKNNQQSNFKRSQVVGISYWLLVAILTSTSILAGSALAASPVAPASNPLSKIILSESVSDTNTVAPVKIAQASDVAGNWAEPFIRALVDKEIIKGYPDGTFRPNQPINRAEFAALLNRAFSLQPVRATRKFKDVPKKFWGAEVVQKATRSGFLRGYSNNTFAPKQNITRIQSLVALVEGSKLDRSGSLDLNTVFGDAAQVPGYGQNSLIAATQRCVAVSQEYDNSKLQGGNFNPDAGATRADVAAYIHQVLVAAGRLPALDKASAANKYIVSCPQGVYTTSITGTPEVKPPEVVVAPPKLTNEEALAQLRIPTLSLANVGSPTTAYPVGGIGSPAAFGANGGDVFVGGSYQASTRPTIYNTPPGTAQGTYDGAVSAGFGLGDARNLVALETIATSYSTFRRGFFNDGALSFKLHKSLSDTFAVAGGYENAILWGGGGNDGGQTGYGVASLVLNPDANIGLFSNTTVSVGAGAGRFRSVGDIRTGKDSYNVFGSVGTRLSPNFSLIADWNGQDLSVGLPITIPLGGTSLQVVPSLVDLVNPETGGSRFVVNAGLGFKF